MTLKLIIPANYDRIRTPEDYAREVLNVEPSPDKEMRVAHRGDCRYLQDGPEFACHCTARVWGVGPEVPPLQRDLTPAERKTAHERRMLAHLETLKAGSPLQREIAALSEAEPDDIGGWGV